MMLDFPTRIVNIGSRVDRRNCRKISCRRDFQIRTLNSGPPYKFIPISTVTTKRRHAPALTSGAFSTASAGRFFYSMSQSLERSKTQNELARCSI
jgi:hypothetical protein